MTDLQDALIKAKLGKEEQRKSEQLPTVEKEHKPEHKQNFIQLSPKFEKFETLFNTEKSKPFAIHLLYSFLPFPDNDYIWRWEDKVKWKNGKKCCICGLETLSKNDIFKNIDNQTEITFEGIRRTIKDENFNASEFYKEQKQKMYGDRLLGVTSERTSCIMCAPCYETFANWVNTRMIMDDHHSFCNLITKIRMANTFKRSDTLS